MIIKELDSWVTRNILIPTVRTATGAIEWSTNDGTEYVCYIAQALVTNKETKEVFRHRFESEPLPITSICSEGWRAFDLWCYCELDKLVGTPDLKLCNVVPNKTFQRNS